MKKFLFLLAVVVLVAVACQKAPSIVSDEKLAKTNEQPSVQSGVTGDAAVDSIGSDLSNADAAEKELTGQNLEDIDGGLQDIQNI